MREHLPAQRARREAPQRPPAEQAEPLTAHPKIVETVNFGWPSFLLPVHGFEPVSIYI